MHTGARTSKGSPLVHDLRTATVRLCAHSGVATSPLRAAKGGRCSRKRRATPLWRRHSTADATRTHARTHARAHARAACPAHPHHLRRHRRRCLPGNKLAAASHIADMMCGQGRTRCAQPVPAMALAWRGAAMQCMVARDKTEACARQRHALRPRPVCPPHPRPTPGTRPPAAQHHHNRAAARHSSTNVPRAWACTHPHVCPATHDAPDTQRYAAARVHASRVFRCGTVVRQPSQTLLADAAVLATSAGGARGGTHPHSKRTQVLSCT
jgi:hypothetical protein